MTPECAQRWVNKLIRAWAVMSGETADETQAVSLGEERTYVTADLTFSQADKEK